MAAEKIKRVEVNGHRHYQVSRGKDILGVFPSVTTVLGGTSDKSGLDAWKSRVGEEEANRISTMSMNRGTVMHRLIELYKQIPGTKEERLGELKKLLHKDREIKQFDTEFIEEGFKFFMILLITNSFSFKFCYGPPVYYVANISHHLILHFYIESIYMLLYYICLF
jgi:hypothetical protein